MGRFLFFLAIATIASMASNIFFGFLIGVVCSIILDVYLVCSGKLKNTGKGYYHNEFESLESFKGNRSYGHNPANGLPMRDFSTDIMGNPMGTGGHDEFLK